MSLSRDLLDAVRRRALFACEYCGVTEDASGGELTIDHYQPRALGGPTEADNLVYCCFRCNSYKADYWPAGPTDTTLWNPRRNKRDAHFLLLQNGELFPVTEVAAFTIERL